MKGNNIIRIFLLFLSIALFSSPASLTFAFGPDVEIVPSSKQIITFDADYNLDTGEMYVAVVEDLDRKISLYKSSDHGLHWRLVRKISTACGSGTVEYPTAPVKLIYSEKFDRLFIFHPTSNKKLCVKRILPSTGSVLHTQTLNIPFDID